MTAPATKINIELDATEPVELPLVMGIGFELVAVNGPAGWPVVRLTGANAVLRAYIRNQWGDDLADDLEAEGEL